MGLAGAMMMLRIATRLAVTLQLQKGAVGVDSPEISFAAVTLSVSVLLFTEDEAIARALQLEEETALAAFRYQRGPASPTSPDGLDVRRSIIIFLLPNTDQLALLIYI